MGHPGTRVDVFSIFIREEMPLHRIEVNRRADASNPPIKFSILERPFEEPERRGRHERGRDDRQGEFVGADRILRIRILVDEIHLRRVPVKVVDPLLIVMVPVV